MVSVKGDMKLVVWLVSVTCITACGSSAETMIGPTATAQNDSAGRDDPAQRDRSDFDQWRLSPSVRREPVEDTLHGTLPLE